MQEGLNQHKIDYVLYHLGFEFEITDAISSRFVFGNSLAEQPSVVFKLSENPLDLNTLFYVEEIPVLYPLEGSKLYSFEKGSLIFHHDVLKSAFHLLSGYQEYNSENLDNHGRFKYEGSIQQKLGIVKKPVVNYYFRLIADAIEVFCEQQQIEFKRKSLFENYGFMLTHDVDRVDAYDVFGVGLRVKQLLGMLRSPYTKFQSLKLFIVAFFNWLNCWNRKNPYWNFDYLVEQEKKNEFKSVFYFLTKNQYNVDSRYHFEDKRIVDLMIQLQEQGCEIGLHGTVQSATDTHHMKTLVERLKKVLKGKLVGGRQHILVYDLIKTTLVQEKAGLQYDTTLGFAEHEGFRNSYCSPFKLYDFEQDRMIDVWELPLNVMDQTITGYRKLNFDQMRETVKDVVEEVQQFNGVFTLLWHNCHFDEDSLPGITAFYESLLTQIAQTKPESILGLDLVGKLNNNL